MEHVGAWLKPKPKGKWHSAHQIWRYMSPSRIVYWLLQYDCSTTAGRNGRNEGLEVREEVREALESLGMLDNSPVPGQSTIEGENFLRRHGQSSAQAEHRTVDTHMDSGCI